MIIRYLLVSTIALVSCEAGPSLEPIKLSPEYFHPIQSLYHSQDQLGHYVYGYATPTISKSETKTPDGVTHGGYSYIDGDGHLQTVQYTADPHNGFRVAATNLPVEAADVAQARAAHLAEFEAIKSERANKVVPVPYFNPVSVPHNAVPELPAPVTDLPEVVQARAQHLAVLHEAYRNAQGAQLGYGLPQAPLPVQDLPEVVKARQEHLAAVAKERAIQSQLRAEVALSPVPENLNGHVVPIQTHVSDGNPLPVAPQAQLSYTPEQYGFNAYSYGYIGPHSAKSETQTSDGVVRGGYSYIDAHGIVQTVTYIADKAGFRVAATNIPVDKNHLSQPSSAPAAPVAEEKILVPVSYSTSVEY
ncbi:uncharacterized protein [Euwallacea similis]|uniref:uncharacterized protein n=1 Tax=Euwallacea similis TaxID=1736056 RepID=UPI00344D36F2